MTNLTRTNKTISFAHYDAYELDLLAYALDPARGKFGPYIKRLIERDRDGGQAQVVAVKAEVEAPVVVDGMRKVASGFL